MFSSNTTGTRMPVVHDFRLRVKNLVTWLRRAAPCLQRYLSRLPQSPTGPCSSSPEFQDSGFRVTFPTILCSSSPEFQDSGLRVTFPTILCSSSPEFDDSGFRVHRHVFRTCSRSPCLTASKNSFRHASSSHPASTSTSPSSPTSSPSPSPARILVPHPYLGSRV